MLAKLAGSASALAILATLGLAPANAQTHSNVVSFGDSLSDNGNLGAAGPPAPYFNRRFSNGLVWTEILAGQIRPQAGPNGTMNNVGPVVPGANSNFSFGGARTDNNVAAPPGVPAQITTFGALGGTFGPQTLVTVLAGANDIFQALPGAAANPATAITVMQGVSGTAAANVGTSVQGLAASGARTILVGNLPALNAAPQFAGGPAEALAGLSTIAFNTALSQRLAMASAASPGANIILMDVSRLFADVQGNPARYGLTNVTANCTTTPACVGVPANQPQYLFWDGVHPTAVGHQTLARLATDYIFYGTAGAAHATMADVGLATRQSAQDASISRIQAVAAVARAAGAGPTPNNGEVTFTVDGRRVTTDPRGPVGAYDTNSGAARLTLDRVFTRDIRAGVTLSYTHNDVSGSNVSTFSTNGMAVDAYLAWTAGQFQLNAVAGFGVDAFDEIRRRTALGTPHSATTRGMSYSAGAQLGYAIPVGGLTVTPQGTISVMHAAIDGFSEDGPSARLTIGSRRVTAVVGEVGVRVDAALAPGVVAHAVVGYRGNLSYSGNSINVGILDNTARVLNVSLTEPQASALRVGVGIQGRLAANVTLGIEYDGLFAGDRAAHAGRARIGIQF